MARILLIDDDSELTHFLQQDLTQTGHQVECLERAEEGPQRLAQGAFDLVLLDNKMPGMSGIELLTELRRVAPALPVAVTSAHALDGTLTSLLGHADEYLEKPVRVDTLIATATALIGQGRRPATDAGL